MQFNNIVALVPEGEHFDESAIVNEGVFLSLGHVQNIENAINGHAAAIATATANTEAAQVLASEANEALTTANNTIVERDATIADLNAQIATLKAAPAATMQQTGKEKDEIPEGGQAFESEITKEANRLRALRDGKKK